MTGATSSIDQLCVQSIRALAIDAVQKANSGHPGMPLGAAPMAFALWSRFLQVCPNHPKWFNRDRFVLSAGHGSMLQYALMHLAGFDLSIDDLKQFRQLGSKTPGHPENHVTPGVEMATGPLGQGIATAVGMAIAERYLAAHFNRPGHDIVDHWTYVICSDGDLMEGISQESASLAGHQKLGKLVALYDSNGITIDGSTDLAFTENVGDRYRALGWHVLEVDGMSVDAVALGIEQARIDPRPSLIVCKTVIGYGSPNKAGSEKSHGSPLGVDEVKLTKAALGIPAEPDFWVAPEAYTFFESRKGEMESVHKEWNDRLGSYASDFPELHEELIRAIDGRLVLDWFDGLPQFEGAMATRKASHATIQSFGKRSNLIVGGSADLAESNFTNLADTQPMQASSPAGRNIPFGVREHGMAAAVNGINLHGGLRAFGATFLIFSDYCRPSLRLAALMGCPSKFAFTHDSIGVGEDGPTHQPIEQVMSLRMIPNLWVFRPADAAETAVCWAMAMARNDGPSALCLTRQNLQPCTPNANADHPARRGGYVLRTETKPLDVTLVATGSEVNLALSAAQALEQEGLGVRVVSLPCWEVFEAQSREYQDGVISELGIRVSIEAGTTLGWSRYADWSIGIDQFGASAPGDVLMRHFGFDVEQIVQHIKKGLAAERLNPSFA